MVSYYADRIASSFALSLSLAVHALDARVNGMTSTKANDCLSGRSCQGTFDASSVVGRRASLSAVREGSNNNIGLSNLGNTCFLNSVLQCLYHCVHVRHQVQLLPPSKTPLGDGLRELFRVRSEYPTRCLELLQKLVASVECVFKHCVGFVEGAAA